ncbi:MAG: L-threonylcarbamoyladenylate synthase [Woeseiaceae bacterium]|nr:L-threonylcarbamoyladenylate synthase [Woeseiaceae bacterium]
MKLAIARAADVLLGGGVVAYPTEGVFGLGCLPDMPSALMRLLAIKQRDPAKGLILLATSKDQLEPWVAGDELARLPAPDPARPVTWLVRASDSVNPLVRGAHSGVAVRLTTNPVAARLCDAVQSALTSTSANVSGRPIARNRILLTRVFRSRVDFIVPGHCGPARGPSEIRRLSNNERVRPAKT